MTQIDAPRNEWGLSNLPDLVPLTGEQAAGIVGGEAPRWVDLGDDAVSDAAYAAALADHIMREGREQM